MGFLNEHDRSLGVKISTYEGIRKDNDRVETVPSTRDILSRFGTWGKFWESIGLPLDYNLKNKFMSVRRSLLEARKQGRVEGVPSEKEFLDTLKKIREQGDCALTNYLKVDMVEHFFGSVRSFLVEGYLENINKLRAKEIKQRDIARELGISYNEISRIEGRLSRAYMEETYGNLASLVKQDVEGIPNPNGGNKQRLRESICDLAMEHLQVERRKGIKYLGLEGPNFRSYMTLFTEMRSVINDESLVVEMDPHSYRVMKSIVRNSRLWSAESSGIFEGLNLRQGDLVDVVGGLDEAEFGFNVVNLDYNGQFSGKKEKTIDLLFEKKLVDSPALFIFTVNNNPIQKEWVERAYGTDDQLALIGRALERNAPNSVQELHSERYRDSSSMAFAAYLVK